jgi:hypothetical protein
MPKKTTEQFIQDAQEIHKDENGNPIYLYTKTKYNINTEHVTITCRIHGDFQQTPKNHLQSRGCSECGKIKVKNQVQSTTSTTAEFIEKAIQVHHDENGNPLYIYDEVEYVNSKTDVTIKCKQGHTFIQESSKHLQGNGCPDCNGSKKLTTAEFIKRAQNIHKDEDNIPIYDYTNTNYKNTDTEVSINCPNGHTFLQTPRQHIRNERGCGNCMINAVSTTKNFIEESNKVHKNFYSYSKTIFTNMKNIVTITCPKHGDFNQVAVCHLIFKRKCKKCVEEENNKESEEINNLVEQLSLENKA